jgi:GR25 family glycosyltransferase involved in LPS biosynthesis
MYSRIYVITICAIVIMLFVMIHLWFMKSMDEPTTGHKLFDEIYLINLKRRPDRLKTFLQKYRESDLSKYPLVKFDAVDGSLLDIDKVPLSELAKAELQQLQTTGFRTKHYQLTKGAIGCYLSHLKIWENILKNEYNSALIFEDDADIPHNILERIQNEMIHIPTDWDIVLLGYLCSQCYQHENYNKVERFMLTHCMLIKSSAIRKILATEVLLPITQQIDALLSELSSVINIYTVKDRIVRQFSSRTDIQAPLKNKHSQGVNDRVRVLK